MTVCHVAMETEAAQAKYAQKREGNEWHDGSFKSWRKERSDSHPYKYTFGTKIWVSETDLGLGGDFLSTGDDST